MRAALRNEIGMHLDIVHVPRPDHQGVPRIRRSEIAVTSALDHQPQIVIASEVYSCGDVVRISCGDRINARLRRPCTQTS